MASDHLLAFVAMSEEERIKAGNQMNEEELSSILINEALDDSVD